MEDREKSPEGGGSAPSSRALLETILGRPAAAGPDDLRHLSEHDPEALGVLLTVREIGNRIKTGDGDGQGSRPQDLRAR